MDIGKMKGTNATLLLILGFVAVVVISFIWFIATWDASREAPVVRTPAAQSTDVTA